MIADGSFDLAPIESFWNFPRADLVKALDSQADGLDEAEVARRRAAVGANRATEELRFGAARELFRLVLNPLVLILLVASAVSAVLGDGSDRRSSLRSSSLACCSTSTRRRARSRRRKCSPK